MLNDWKLIWLVLIKFTAINKVLKFSQYRCDALYEKEKCILIGFRTRIIVLQSTFTLMDPRCIVVINWAYFLNRKLWHINYKALIRVVINKIVRGVPELGEPNNKVVRVPWRKTSKSHKKIDEISNYRPLDLLYMNLMDLMRIESIAG